MSTLPKEERFEIDEYMASALIAGQSVIINGQTHVVKYISLKKGTFDRVLVATTVPYLRLTKIEEK